MSESIQQRSISGVPLAIEEERADFIKCKVDEADVRCFWESNNVRVNSSNFLQLVVYLSLNSDTAH